MSKTAEETNAAFWDWLKNRTKSVEAEFEYLYAEIPLPPKTAPEEVTSTETEVNFEIDTTIDLEDSPTKAVPGKEIVFKF